MGSYMEDKSDPDHLSVSQNMSVYQIPPKHSPKLTAYMLKAKEEDGQMDRHTNKLKSIQEASLP